MTNLVDITSPLDESVSNIIVIMVQRHLETPSRVNISSMVKQLLHQVIVTVLADEVEGSQSIIVRYVEV